jgi:hypothetical protein
MRLLSNPEVTIVSGAKSEDHSYTQIYWTSFVESAGTTVGIFCSPFIMAGMIGYGALYGAYTGVSAVCSGIYNGGTYILNSSVAEPISE